MLGGVRKGGVATTRGEWRLAGRLIDTLCVVLIVPFFGDPGVDTDKLGRPASMRGPSTCRCLGHLVRISKSFRRGTFLLYGLSASCRWSRRYPYGLAAL